MKRSGRMPFFGPKRGTVTVTVAITSIRQCFWSDNAYGSDQTSCAPRRKVSPVAFKLLIDLVLVWIPWPKELIRATVSANFNSSSILLNSDPVERFFIDAHQFAGIQAVLVVTWIAVETLARLLGHQKVSGVLVVVPGDLVG